MRLITCIWESVLFFFLLLASTVAALPVEAYSSQVTTTSGLLPRVTGPAESDPNVYKPSELEEELITDDYLFNLTLDSFISKRDNQCPSYLFWESDGCSDSPDHPFGFDYLPACYRHDFGYDQYRRQSRFTQRNKEKLDLNFKKDLDNICSAPGLEAEICKQCKDDPKRKDVDCEHRTDICKFPAKDVCTCLADVYYRAVVTFGGQGTIQPDPKEKRGGIFDKLIGKNIPDFDLGTLGLCMAKNLALSKVEPTF